MIRSLCKWILRILFFPIWIWALRRKHKRELAMRARCGCYPIGGQVITDDCEIHSVKILVHGQEMKEGNFFYSEQYPHYREKLDSEPLKMELKTKPPGLLHWIDGIQIDGQARYRAMEWKTAHPNAKLRSLVLMTDRNQAVKDGKCPPNTFVLLGSDKDMEVISENVKVRYQEFYPKAMDLDTGRTSYDQESGLFKSIERDSWKRRPNCQYGPEFIFKMPNDELVKVFCGSKSRKRQSEKIRRISDAEHRLTVKTITTNQFTWSTIQFEFLGFDTECATPDCARVIRHKEHKLQVYCDHHKAAAPEQYTLELLNEYDNVLFTEKVTWEKQQGSIVIHAQFMINKVMMQVFSRVKKNGIILAKKRRVMGQVGPGTIIRVHHTLTPIGEPTWMDTPISELNNKRLWNIAQAMERGTWASGSVCKIKYDLAQDLWREFNKRRANGKFTKKKIKKIKKQNKAYEAKFCTHGRDPHKTYPGCKVCKEEKKLLKGIKENIHKIQH